MSQLTLIAEEEYKTGLRKMRSEKSGEYTGEFATMRLVARKSG
jgi:hypothetical protein